MISDSRPFTYIQSNDVLQQVCEGLKHTDIIAVDTEFTREKTFFPILSTIQIATPVEVAVIDALSPSIDLSLLKEAFFSSSIKKVFHAGRQDLEIFYHLWGEVPAPIADTQILAMIQGFGDSVGYQSLVKSLLGKNLSKTCRTSNWMIRPLEEAQIMYAAGDVVYLLEIYKKLLKQGKERLPWIAEELSLLLDPNTYAVLPEEAWKKINIPLPVTPHAFGKIQALAHWREREAVRLNKPRTHILSDLGIIEISNASNSRQKIAQWIGKKECKEYAIEELAAQLETALPPATIPASLTSLPPSTSFNEVLMLDVLKVYHKMVSQKYNVAPRLIGTVDDLRDLIQTRDPSLKVLQGWRHEIFGKEALAFLKGERAFKVLNGILESAPVES